MVRPPSVRELLMADSNLSALN
ncbi:hypothetical protein Golob_013328 [Gossypium lobatum]|uniref:Uncharacterized protein n=1 Tax=Gossypium lobatum TaxID=34289 RepID=A0A7J8LP54_9ROSI|nr:hypothetical protein [Gossypium lobatum]